MRIALIGYGKMGQQIAQMACQDGHEIVLVIDPVAVPSTTSIPLARQDGWNHPALRSADVAIEFTTPATAETNVLRLLGMGIPTISGTTGWDIQTAWNKSEETGTGFLWSSNFSIGVNLFFALNERLAQMMKGYAYQPSITEIHHIHKLDKPSGTAKTLAEQISFSLGEGGGEVPIESIREGEVSGIHTVRWDSRADTIRLIHEAKSREGFAAGALLAAAWLQGKKGPHLMREVLAS